MHPCKGIFLGGFLETPENLLGLPLITALEIYKTTHYLVFGNTNTCKISGYRASRCCIITHALCNEIILVDFIKYKCDLVSII